MTLANPTWKHRIITMDNTLELSDLSLHESYKMDNYEENGFEEPELLFEASPEETDESSETDESLRSDNSFDSDDSLDSDESLDLDECIEVDDKANPVASALEDDEQQQDDESLQAEDDVFHAQEEKLDQVEGVQVEADIPGDVKIAPQKSKWLTQWFQRREELY
ncbi:hypothetical protein SLS63_010344 [Diaporthe eres]|uniref:Uncharacterized protein n=1 Tax=Diaporthe eres TaxID=83184 RepID=A0ABR1NX15_DIAER